MAPDADTYRGALEAVDRVLNREPEADEVLRQVVAVLGDRLDPYDWVGISFLEEGAPAASWHGAHAEGAPTHDEEVVYDGTKVATLIYGTPRDTTSRLMTARS